MRDVGYVATTREAMYAIVFRRFEVLPVASAKCKKQSTAVAIDSS